MLKAHLEAPPQIRQSLRQSNSFTFKAAKLVRDSGVSIEKAVSQAIDNRLLIGKPIPLRARDEALIIESLTISDVFTIESIESFILDERKINHG